MRKYSIIPLVLLLSTAIPAFAGDASVRANVQDGFVRFVFSGENLPETTVKDVDKSTLKIVFSRAVSVDDLSGATGGVAPPMVLQRDSDTTLALKVEGEIVRHRTLVLGKRLFVDVFTKATPALAFNTTPKTIETGIKPALPDTVVVEDVQPKAAPEKPEVVAIAAPPENAALASALKSVEAQQTEVPKQAKVFNGTATITIGSTQGLSLAAFERLGYLWIVVSQQNMNVPPVVSGPQASALGPVDAVSIDGGSAYRIKLPEGAFVRPEGAGLVWRLFIEGKKPTLRSATVDRDFSNTAEGPQVHIPLQTANSVLRLPDPEIGDDLAVVTVGRADSRLLNSDHYVDFDVLPAIVGAVIRPKADGMRVAVLPTEVVLGRQGGLRISAAGPRRNVMAADMPEDADKPKVDDKKLPSHLFKLADWSLGGPKQYLDSRRLLDTRIAAAEESQKITELLTAAKFMLAQGLPQEGLGYVSMALSYMPLLKDSADFQALRGAMLALVGQTEEGFAALSSQGLENNDEIKLWQAYTLAQMGRLPEAQKLIPAGAKALLANYPERVQAMLLPPIIDAVLARGDVTLASSFVDYFEKAANTAGMPDSGNAVAYYRGKVAYLRGENDVAVSNFRETADGVTGPYPALATLALVERGLSAKTISREDAISKLERFRYYWRGDTLETDILQRLGLIYVTGGEQRRGLTILRDAATLAPDETTRERLVSVMQKAFKELFSGKTKEKMSPIEAAAVATEFAELMPAGGDGEEITLNIAGKMQAIDLLDRAADMIEPMIERTESMQSAIKYAQRAAAIRITDERPEDALRNIDKALSRPDVQTASALEAKDLKAFALLRAKAKHQQKRIDAAFIELNSVPEDIDVLRLKADIAWSTQRWRVAADALGKLVQAANMDALRPPTQEQAQMLLNYALALNLSSNTAALDALRVGYNDIMRRTDMYQPFQLVTRTAREAKLADRDTLLKLVSEVNMFRDVLDEYKNTAPVQKTAVSAPVSSQSDQKGQAEPVEPGQAAGDKG